MKNIQHIKLCFPLFTLTLAAVGYISMRYRGSTVVVI